MIATLPHGLFMSLSPDALAYANIDTCTVFILSCMYVHELCIIIILYAVYLQGLHGC